MATANNTIKTRIQLKSDTEANWNKAGPKENSTGFVPLRGELIIYSADNAHPFSRLKIGDGETNVVNLPFVDAGTLNGTEVELVKKNIKDNFPETGSQDKLYVDLSTNSIYHYDGSSYTQLSNFTYATTSDTATKISSWRPGDVTSASIENHVFRIVDGVAPSLSKYDISVLTNIQRSDE